MKGKKFTAAEKYFQEKELKLKKEIATLEKANQELRITREKLMKSNYDLQSENIILQDHVDRLLEFTEMSKEDIKIACDKNKKFSELSSVFNILGRYI